MTMTKKNIVIGIGILLIIFNLYYSGLFWFIMNIASFFWEYKFLFVGICLIVYGSLMSVSRYDKKKGK